MKKYRILQKMVQEIALKHEIELVDISFGWILMLTKNNVTKFIFGNNFEINSSTSQLIAGDKAATYEVLKKNSIPVVEHVLFLIKPRLRDYMTDNLNWSRMVNYFNENNNNIICKPVRGTGGMDIIKINNLEQLEQAVNYLFSKHMGICFSPFIEIENEYRVFILDNQVELIYRKIIPSLIGDGKSTLINLLLKECSKNSKLEIMKELISSKKLNFQYVLKKNEEFKIHWKHNLQQGGFPEIIDKDHTFFNSLAKLAVKSAEAINIRFASVDIIELKDGSFKVLEINHGVMAEYLTNMQPNIYSTIKNMFEKAVLKMFN